MLLPRPRRGSAPRMRWPHAGLRRRHIACCLREATKPESSAKEGAEMVSIVTSVRLKQGREREWDDAMRERMAAAGKQSGWIGGQLLQPESATPSRIIVGTWQSREAWARWHADPQF